MSWHATGLLIKADYSADYPALLQKLGLNAAETDETISFDEATSSSNDDLAVATVDGWTCLWSNLGLLAVSPDGAAEVAKTADVFELVLEGASGTAGFTWWTGGRKVRDWMRQAGDIVKDEGKPLPHEKKAFQGNDDEQAVLDLLIRMTLPYERLESVEYQVFELSMDDLPEE